MKLKKPNVKKVTAEIPEVETNSVEAILEVEKAVKEVVFGRASEIRGLLLSVISEQHMMMEGDPGIAKTKLAKEFFRRIAGDESEELNVFKIQMSRSIPPDMLIGPMSIRKLRESDTYEYNTSGRLPSAHFAVLDEVYRGPEMLLPTVLSILNEREFFNGVDVITCPLITAVGTTNFIVDKTELDAFQDRWLFNFHVNRLDNSKDRLRMLASTLYPSDKIGATISMTQIRDLIAKRKEVKVNSTIFALYEQLAEKMRFNGRDILRRGLSDRRIAAALRVAQAAAVLRKSPSVTPDDLAYAEAALVTKGLPDHEKLFADSYAAEIGNYQRLLKDEEDLALMRQLRDRWYERYNEKLPRDRLHKLQQQLRDGIDDRRQKRPISSSMQVEFDSLIKDYEDLLAQVSTDLN